MATKMPRRLVALSASAVATIYVAGLLSTEPSANNLVVDAAGEPPVGPTLTIVGPNPPSPPEVVVGASAPAAPASQPSPAPATSTGSAGPPTATPARAATTPPAATTTPTTASAPVRSPTPAPTATSQPAAAASTYADGTYTGTGTSRLGNVTASVTISNDRITNVQITRSTTKYPVSRIASLPAQVIAAQSPSVNVVSGATYSSQAFRDAVQQALAQARAAA